MEMDTGLEVFDPNVFGLYDVRVFPHSEVGWFGVEIRFAWRKELPPDQVSLLIEDNGTRGAVISKALSTPEYRDFYAERRRVGYQEVEGGEEIVVTVPRFNASEFTLWEFNSYGGWLCAGESVPQ